MPPQRVEGDRSMGPLPESKAAYLATEEYLSAGDDRFLEQFHALRDPKRLAPIADRLKKDHRPWARERVLRYVALPMDRPGHQPVVKRLFKHAEERGDVELMAAFYSTSPRSS